MVHEVVVQSRLETILSHFQSAGSSESDHQVVPLSDGAVPVPTRAFADASSPENT